MTDLNYPFHDQATAAAAPDTDSSEAAARRPYVEPRLRFIEPKLTPRGDLRQVTAGFFGSFEL